MHDLARRAHSVSPHATLKEDAMKRRINLLIQSLVLIRFGQELGTDSPVAKAIYELLELIRAIPLNLF